ncbi:hypothetical protein E0D81_14005 [Lelliottia amnigena]|nr:hypothetical protein E0D81_14005 [Lelliottia amnigena]
MMVACLPATIAPIKKPHIFTGTSALLHYAKKWTITLVEPDFQQNCGEHYDENQRAYRRI